VRFAPRFLALVGYYIVSVMVVLMSTAIFDVAGAGELPQAFDLYARAIDWLALVWLISIIAVALSQLFPEYSPSKPDTSTAKGAAVEIGTLLIVSIPSVVLVYTLLVSVGDAPLNSIQAKHSSLESATYASWWFSLVFAQMLASVAISLDTHRLLFEYATKPEAEATEQETDTQTEAPA